MTLLEIMIASAIATIIALGLAMIEGTRARVHEDSRRRLLDEPERKNAALAALRIVKDLETSDFVTPFDSVNQLINIRIPDCQTNPPTGACYTINDDFLWVQYRRITTTTPPELRMYRFPRAWPPASCPAGQLLSREITAMTFTPTTNQTTYSITWTSGTRSQVFQGRAISRYAPDQAVANGLAPAGVSLPTALVCS